MKNKLLARIAASAISVTMLGTVAFAAETGAMPSLSDVEGDATTKMLSFMVGDTNIIKPVVAEGETAPDQVTMMSYLVASTATYASCDYVDEATTPMIALDQVTYADSFAAGVKVAASKLEANPTMKIVVKRGDSNGGTDKWLFALAEDGKTVTFMNGTTATPVKAVDGTVTLPPAPTLDATAGYAVKAFTFIGWVNEEDTVLYTEDLTGVTEDMVLYAKYDTGIVYGDVTGDGIIKPADRLGINAYLKDGTIRNFTNSKIDPNVNVIAGDVTGDNIIKPADRLGVNAFLKDGTIRNKTNSKIYYVNK